MLEQGWFYDENGNLMHKDDVGVPNPGEGPPITRSPVTRSYRQPLQPLRKIGSPGVWNDITAWWTGLKTEHKLGIGALGGLAVIGIAVAATRKGETGLRKV